MPMPAGAFALAPVPTPAALVAQAEHSAALQSRWGMALGLGQNVNVASFFKTLHLSPLPSTRAYRVYYVRPDGVWGYKIRLVPQNTPVFASAVGTPLLLQVCANPIRSLSRSEQANAPQAKPWSPTESDAGMIVEGTSSASGIGADALTSGGSLDSTGSYFGSDAAANSGAGLSDSFASSGAGRGDSFSPFDDLLSSGAGKLLSGAASALKGKGSGGNSGSGSTTKADRNSNLSSANASSGPSLDTAAGISGTGLSGSGVGGSGSGLSPVPEPGLPVFLGCVVGVVGVAVWNGRRRRKAADVSAIA